MAGVVEQQGVVLPELSGNLIEICQNLLREPVQIKFRFKTAGFRILRKVQGRDGRVLWKCVVAEGRRVSSNSAGLNACEEIRTLRPSAV